VNFKLRIWRQPNAKEEGNLVEYKATDISPHASVLEMLDIVNEQLILRGETPISFDSDCREGICGTCVVPVLEGEPEHRDHCLSKKEKAANDQICACVSRSRSARLVLGL